jgi:hypothetical protein
MRKKSCVDAHILVQMRFNSLHFGCRQCLCFVLVAMMMVGKMHVVLKRNVRVGTGRDDDTWMWWCVRLWLMYWYV